MKNTHLTLDERIFIKSELDHNVSFKEIARQLQKDCTTISKEVRKHLVVEQVGCYGRTFNDCHLRFLHVCKERYACPHCVLPSHRACWNCGRCREHCKHYSKYLCPSRSKPPYVCNGCSEKKRCTLEKSFYKPNDAQRQYEYTLSQSRKGLALSEQDLLFLDSVISPLLSKGQSLHHIAVSNVAEIMLSERTLYSYVDQGLFSAKNIDMPRKVRMRSRKGCKKGIRVEKQCREGRTYPDFLDFMAKHPDLPVCQMDSLEGVKGGKVLLTLMFTAQKLQISFLRDHNNAQSVTNVFDRLYLELGPDLFMRLFPVILTDNGSEFTNPSAIEFDRQGQRRSYVFYCDPQAPFQKGSCENNHEMIRRIIPKGTDLGQFSQQQISLRMSHINSYSRKDLADKCPLDLFFFLYGQKSLDVFELRKIAPNEIILKPQLLRSCNRPDSCE